MDREKGINTMNERDRLIELIEKAPPEYEKGSKGIADHLLANGVTLSPLPIGSTVYEIRARGKRPALCGMRKCDYGIATEMMFKNAIAQRLDLFVREKAFKKYDVTRWNKTIFATKEQAEKVLKERQENEIHK